MKKIWKDIYLLAGIIIAAVLFWRIPYLMHQEEPGTVKVFRDGVEIGEYLLKEEQTISIPFEAGGYNLLFISNGKASVSDADCRDGLCVRQREISHNGESIICLPHKLVIRIEAKEESELDAVTY